VLARHRDRGQSQPAKGSASVLSRLTPLSISTWSIKERYALDRDGGLVNSTNISAVSLLCLSVFSFAMTHCGGDDNTGGGSSGAAGDGSGGTAGSLATTGGAGGSQAAGSGGTMGSAGTTGSAGTMGSAGGSPVLDAGRPTGDSGACPPSEPSGSCSLTSQPCYYTMSYCYCDRDVLGDGGNRWFCNGGDSGLTANCPATKPAPGTACPTSDLTYCHYDAGVCICNGRGGGSNKNNWTCY
jgi:hypothetical protein